MKPRSLDLDSPNYHGEARLYEVLVSDTVSGPATKRFGVLAHDIIDATEEALGFVQGDADKDFEIKHCESRLITPTVEIAISYKDIPAAPHGIFHGGTKEWHPAFKVQFAKTGELAITARAVAWTHLIEKSGEEFPFILVVYEM